MATATKEKKIGELIIHRIFDAPREQVWKAWTEPELVQQWWGPKDFTAPSATIDLQVGGKYLYCMRSPDGKDFWSTGVFRELKYPEKIVVTDSFSDKKGNVVPASYYDMPGEFPLELAVTITFEARKKKTKFTLRYEGFPLGEANEQAKEGWNQSLDKLAALLEKERASREKTVILAETGKAGGVHDPDL